MTSIADLYAAMAGVPSPRGESTAGTAGDGYMTADRPHRFTAEPPDYGRRPLCAVCGDEQAGHAVPAPRVTHEPRRAE